MTGWKTITSNSNYEVKCYNNTIVEYNLHTTGDVNVTSSVQTLPGWIPNGYIPPTNISTNTSHGFAIVTARIDGAIGYHSPSKTGGAKLNALMYWRKI